MTTGQTNPPASQPAATREAVGRVASVSGSHATVGVSSSSRVDPDRGRATVGRFFGIKSGPSVIIGLITEITECREQTYQAIACLDLVGEIKPAPDGTIHFQRGVTDYPSIGDPAMLMTDQELRAVYEGRGFDMVPIGHLHQDRNLAAKINIDELLGRQFAILGTTGTGKSSGVAIILQQILMARPNLRIFLVDPHNEYARCFGDKAQVLTPRNLRLPFWLFNFEETVEAIFAGRQADDEELEILSTVIPLAKGAYLQYRAAGGALDRQIVKKKDPRNTGYTADTPVPYRIEDLTNRLDEQMGKLENRSSRMKYFKLIQRIQAVRNDPRYGFMFENANIGGDTMADVLSHLFRLPPNGKPMTIMQLAGFPADVVDCVVSVLCRMAFDFGLWSDGAAPLLLVCEEAHRYAPVDGKIGFGPTRRALSRIAKEGRKYGVFLGLVTQRPAEIDPTIISQCSTLMVMRLANERDQDLIRSAVSDAAATMLAFIPSLGTREVLAFGSGVTVPTRLKFTELPPNLQPNSEARGDTRSDRGANVSGDLIASVIERWRSATMSHKVGYDDVAEYRDEPPQPQPAAKPMPTQAPSMAPPAHATARPGLDPERFRLLRKPPAEGTADVFASPQGAPPRFR